jgi:hypothetical protein
MREQSQRTSRWWLIVDLKIDSHGLPGIVVAADESNMDCVIGRNILNRMRLILGGSPLRLTLDV